MRRITGCLPLAAALLALTACGDDSGGGSAADTAAPTATASDEPEPTEEATTEPAGETSSCDGPPQVTVTDDGAEPRALMELSPTAGDTTAVDMRVTTAVTTIVDGVEAPAQPAVPVLLGMVATVDAVSDDEITVSFVYDNVDVEGADAAGQAMLDTLVGVTGTLTTTRGGAFVDGKVSLEGVDPQLAQVLGQLEAQLGNMTLPLPAEPVGIGAVWETTSSLDSGGIVFCNLTTYRLAEFDGTAYELEVEVAQEVVPGPIAESGGAVEVVGGSGSSTGHSSGSLSLPIAVSGATEGSSQVQLVATEDGTEQTVDLTTDIEMELTLRE